MDQSKPGSMKPISTRSPSVTIEYDCNGKRATKFFDVAYKARVFYAMKYKLGKNPQVVPNVD